MAVILVSVCFFFAVGFFLPILFNWAALSIAETLGSDVAVSKSHGVPIGYSLTLGGVMGGAAGLGLLLKWAEGAVRRRNKL